MTKVSRKCTYYDKLLLLTENDGLKKTDDDEVARKIASKFRSPSAKGVSFCNIAAKAEELGRKKLALMVSRVQRATRFHVVITICIYLIVLAARIRIEK